MTLQEYLASLLMGTTPSIGPSPGREPMPSQMRPQLRPQPQRAPDFWSYLKSLSPAGPATRVPQPTLPPPGDPPDVFHAADTEPRRQIQGIVNNAGMSLDPLTAQTPVAPRMGPYRSAGEYPVYSPPPRSIDAATAADLLRRGFGRSDQSRQAIVADEVREGKSRSAYDAPVAKLFQDVPVYPMQPAGVNPSSIADPYYRNRAAALAAQGRPVPGPAPVSSQQQARYGQSPLMAAIQGAVRGNPPMTAPLGALGQRADDLAAQGGGSAFGRAAADLAGLRRDTAAAYEENEGGTRDRMNAELDRMRPESERQFFNTPAGNMLRQSGAERTGLMAAIKNYRPTGAPTLPEVWSSGGGTGVTEVVGNRLASRDPSYQLGQAARMAQARSAAEAQQQQAWNDGTAKAAESMARWNASPELQAKTRQTRKQWELATKNVTPQMLEAQQQAGAARKQSYVQQLAARRSEVGRIAATRGALRRLRMGQGTVLDIPGFRETAASNPMIGMLMQGVPPDLVERVLQNQGMKEAATIQAGPENRRLDLAERALTDPETAWRSLSDQQKALYRDKQDYMSREWPSTTPQSNRPIMDLGTAKQTLEEIVSRPAVKALGISASALPKDIANVLASHAKNVAGGKQGALAESDLRGVADIIRAKRAETDWWDNAGFWNTRKDYHPADQAMLEAFAANPTYESLAALIKARDDARKEVDKRYQTKPWF